MPKTSRLLTACVLATFAAAASLAAPGASAAASSRVLVSSTLNHGVLVLDAQSLAFTQPMLPSRGTSPVRMDIEVFDGTPYLFTANHGLAASLGIFDLSGDLVVEVPASPIPSGGFGAVGIDVSPGGTVAMTNNWFALGGCSMPRGSLSVYRVVPEAGTLTAVLEGVYEHASAIPWAVAIDESRDSVYASLNCGNELEVFDRTETYLGTSSHVRAARVQTGSRPDATLFDAKRDRSYTVNIASSSLTVVDGASRTPLTTVPLPGAGPIDAALATSAAGSDWILTSNGNDDTFSIIDRDRIEACIQASATSCPAAQVARIPAGVAGGQPEGVSYDPVSGRVFVVNKSPLGSPKLSAIEVVETPGGISASLVGVVPLPAADPRLPAPAIIGFDVVVQTR